MSFTRSTHEQVVPLAQNADVAGVVPAVRQGGRGRFRVVPVAERDVGPPHQDLAGLALRGLAAVVAHDLDGNPGTARPHEPSRGVPSAASSWRRQVTIDDVSVAP